jgi:hypothetical protein
LLSTGFAMSIAANEQTQERIASKLQWLSKQKESPDLPDSRRHTRAVPKNPMATMLLADGSLISCLVRSLRAVFLQVLGPTPLFARTPFWRLDTRLRNDRAFNELTLRCLDTN